MNKRVLSLLVDNTSGVLSRIAGLFSRRGYNIDSLTVGETADPRYSRMTVVVNGDDKILDQITKQLAKLVVSLNILVRTKFATRIIKSHSLIHQVMKHLLLCVYAVRNLRILQFL